MNGVTVIICCFNSVKRLPITLEHLADQIVNVDWEIILVDNGSTDETTEFANNYITFFSSRNIEYKVINEPKTGLSNARRCGVLKARYEYIVFCDDDNWLASNYIQQVYTLFQTKKVDILGGLNEPIFEAEPKLWINTYLDAYACSNKKLKSGPVDCVFGAGMAVRKSKLTQIYAMDFISFLTGRNGKSMSSGEDSEICYLVKLSGGVVYYEEGLSLRHFISKERLEWRYLRKLQAGFAQSQVILNLYSRVLDESVVDVLPRKYWLKQSIYLALRLLRYYPKYYVSSEEGNRFNLLFSSWKYQLLEYWRLKTDINSCFNSIRRLKLELSKSEHN